MNLKKSLFGNYKRNSVDAVIKQMTENEEQAQAKIALLENEFHLSKESAQKSLESIQTELVIRQKSLLDMSRTIEEKNNRIIELETKQSTILADFEEQYRLIISSQEEKYNTKISQLEEENTKKITDLEEEYQQNAKFIQQKEDQVKKIGQLYVDAQEYTEKMKIEAKTKTMESIDRIFGELNKTQEQFEASFVQISQKKNNLKQLMGELLETLHIMKNQVDGMEYDRINFTSVFDNIIYIKDHIKNQIQDEFDKDKKTKKEEPLPEVEKMTEEASSEEVSVKPVFEKKKEKAELIIDYAAQIEELRQKIERQEELFQMRSKNTNTASATTNINEPISNTEPVVTEERPDNKEKYSKYFAEIEKKYYKKKQPDSHESEPAVESSVTMPLPDSSEISEKTEYGEIAENKIVDTEETDNTILKKPSIKDILNKYANMK